MYFLKGVNMKYKNDVLLLCDGEIIIDEKFNDYLDHWGGYLIIDKEELAETILNSATKDIFEKNENILESMDIAIDEFFDQYRQELLDIMEDMI